MRFSWDLHVSPAKDNYRERNQIKYDDGFINTFHLRRHLMLFLFIRVFGVCKVVLSMLKMVKYMCIYNSIIFFLGLILFVGQTDSKKVLTAIKLCKTLRASAFSCIQMQFYQKIISTSEKINFSHRIFQIFTMVSTLTCWRITAHTPFLQFSEFLYRIQKLLLT